MTAPNLPSFELEALHTLLEQEFEFLTNQDFKSFEELQNKKQELLNLLVGEISGDEPDITPEAIDEIADKHIPGFGEIFRLISLGTVGTSSIQSRACAILANGKYIFALPGSSGGVTDAWDEILIHQLDINHKPCNFVELFPRLKEK